MDRYTAEVSRIDDLTHDVRTIELRLIEPSTITFKAGQFVSFEVPKAGAPRPVTRPYSIASPPGRTDRILLLLNLVPGGLGPRTCLGCAKVTARSSPERPELFICETTRRKICCLWQPEPGSHRCGA